MGEEKLWYTQKVVAGGLQVLSCIGANKVLTFPNGLSGFRLGVGVLLAGNGLSELSSKWFAGIIVFAIVSDFLDGWAARFLQQESAFGSLLDPFSDAVFVLGGLLALVRVGIVCVDVLLMCVMRYGCCLWYYHEMRALGFIYSTPFVAKVYAAVAMLFLSLKFYQWQGFLVVELISWLLSCITLVLFFASWYVYYQRYYWYRVSPNE